MCTARLTQAVRLTTRYPSGRKKRKKRSAPNAPRHGRRLEPQRLEPKWLRAQNPKGHTHTLVVYLIVPLGKGKGCTGHARAREQKPKWPRKGGRPAGGILGIPFKEHRGPFKGPRGPVKGPRNPFQGFFLFCSFWQLAPFVVLVLSTARSQGGSPKEFQLLTEARDTLKDPRRRHAHDAELARFAIRKDTSVMQACPAPFGFEHPEKPIAASGKLSQTPSLDCTGTGGVQYKH